MMGILPRLALLFVLAYTSAGFAAEQIVSYKCTLRVFAKDLQKGFTEEKFDRPAASGSHGGEPMELSYGDHTVSVIADGRWRNVSWWIKGKLIAATVSASSENLPGYHTVILYNPANTDEEISLDCAPVKQEVVPGPGDVKTPPAA